MLLKHAWVQLSQTTEILLSCAKTRSLCAPHPQFVVIYGNASFIIYYSNFAVLSALYDPIQN